MPQFSNDATRRIGRAVLQVERDRINSPSPRPVYNSAAPWDWFWVELRENLQASGMGSGSGGDDEASGRVLMWWRDSAQYQVGTQAVVVTDTTNQHWGLAYERILCRVLGSGTSYIYEAVTSGAATHTGTLAAALDQGSSANVTVTIAGQSVTVLAYDNKLCSGQSIASGSTVDIIYDVGLRKWIVSSADCGCDVGSGS